MNFIKRILTSKYFQPIISSLAVVETAVIPVVSWFFSSNSNVQISGIHIIIFAFVAIVTIWVPICIAHFYRKHNDKNMIISYLCEIQNNYLINPEFKTSQQHAEASKEKNLSQGGTAKILTNSLTYDFSSASDIAHNIIDGARYIYILPSTNDVFRSLENYIQKISHELGDAMQSMNLLESSIEFWFFNKDFACLYNFATLRQTTIDNTEAFDQAWWYINPVDNLPSSYMLAKEISMGHDRDTLDNVFTILERNSFKCNGKDVFENFRNLKDFVRR